MSADSIQIRARPAPSCLLCGTEGRLLYEDLPDRSFSAPGRWNLRRCPDAGCGLVWLDPVPIEEDIGLAYHGYYTHSQPEPGPSLVRDACWAVWHSYLGARFGYTCEVGPKWRRSLAPLALLHPGGRDELDAAAMHLPAPRGPARVLDVGCGSGVLLARMQRFGWEVEGVEVDPGGVAAARARGVPVRLGTLEQQTYPDDSFHAIHSAHVIEHVHDPLRLLRECRRILKPGGALVLLTPNIESWGHRRFREAWLNLDPPRHLALFSMKTLRRALEQSGLRVKRLDTTARNAWVYGALSQRIRKTGRGDMKELGKPANLLRGLAYQLRQRWALRGHPDAGDEVRVFAEKG
ncbi:MAG TPA: class I SAM-dependent methyltransferase [Verrucomicrobiae bacterium]|nr:class I SAM-dependent methyltransferase [Verrucomicrobiae bacterium]